MKQIVKDEKVKSSIKKGTDKLKKNYWNRKFHQVHQVCIHFTVCIFLFSLDQLKKSEKFSDITGLV